MDAINGHAPLRKVRAKNRASLPWFDSDLMKLKRKCDKSYASWNRSSLQSHKEVYLCLRNDYQKLLRLKKTEYFNDKTQSSFKNSKKFWEFYQSSIKIKSDKSNNQSTDSLSINGSVVNDKTLIVNEFNRHFSSFESQKDVETPDCKSFIYKTFQSFAQSHKNLFQNQFKFTNTSEKEVLSLLSELDSNSSPGVSGIPVKVLKFASDVLAKPLTELFNECIKQSVFPSEWKTAIVTPLYKNKGASTDVKNYRGISVL